ncbi:MAG: polysaccharide biosynthesis protein [Lactobacillales bacterium]|nr:polysaccharide biosynthesis protein [Lactobacillales bacterium]
MIIVCSNIFSYFFIGPLIGVNLFFYFLATILQFFLYTTYAVVFHLLNRITRFFGLKEIIKMGIAASCTGISESILLLLIRNQVSFRHVFLANFLAIVGIVFVNIFWRMFIVYGNSKNQSSSNIFARKGNLAENSPSANLSVHHKRVLIIGAGEAGFQLMNSFDRNNLSAPLNIVGFVDDDPSKIGTYISWKKVLGSINQLSSLIKENSIEQVIFAIPSISYSRRQKIVSMAMKTGVKITTLPHIEDVALGKLSVTSLKEVDVVDLLGRDEVKLDMESIFRQLHGKTVLVTGAGGSIGSEIVRQLLQFKPAKLLLLGHGEYSIYKINSEIQKKIQDMDIKIVPIIADIKDIKRMSEIMGEYYPDIVYHVAAYKHVPLMEYNPIEAVNNNIYGTLNVAKLAKQYNVKNFVMISTDKAVNPTNVMGATKRIAEMVMMSFNEIGKTKFSAVRFGNVLGSRGSVIPLFKRQIAAGGPITITDFKMTRFFMTIPEASRLVLQSGALSKGGEIFILDMGEPVKIKDLAEEMIRLCGRELDEIPIVETGIRSGEKLYEELFFEREKNSERVYEKIFVTNVEKFELKEIQEFLAALPSKKEKLGKALVSYANNK